MPTFTLRYGPLALVTGAAEGLGRAYAVELAARGLSLLLVDRQEEKLHAVADELRRPDRPVEALALDLSAPDLADRLVDELADRPLGLVVHCAAISPIGPFLEVERETHRACVRTNVDGTLALAHVAGRRLVERGGGGLLLVSSGSAFVGAPRVANYAATKAYVATLASSIAPELEDAGVDVLAVCPGMIRTAATEAHPPRLDRAPWVRMLSAERVARESLDDLGRRVISVPGGLGERLGLAAISRLLPRRAALRILRGTMDRLYAP